MNIPSRGRGQQLALIILVIAGSALRVFVCFQHNPMDYLFSDALRHWENGLHFPRGGYLGAADPIVYQAYMAFIVRTTLGNRFMVALSSALLSVLMPWTYYRAAREFGLRKVPALWVWVLIAWTPSLFTIYHYIMMETLLLVLVGVSLWATGRYLRKGGPVPWLVAVFFWTIACLSKPTVIPLAGVCLLWCCWKKRPSLPAFGIAVVMAVLLLLPQAIHSEIALGFVAPFGNPWLTKIQHRSGAKTINVHFLGRPKDANSSVPNGDYHFTFTSPSVSAQPLAPFSDWHMRRGSANSSIDVTVNGAHGVTDWRNAYDSLKVDSHEWMAQLGENIVLFFFAPSWPDGSVTDWDGWLTMVTRWMWAPLILFALLANFREFLHHRFQLIPVAVTIFTLFLMLQNVATTEGRYRKPLEPLLLLNVVWIVASKPPALSGSSESAPQELQ